MGNGTNKKTTLVVVIVLAVIIVGGGAYYGYNRWQQQRLVNSYYQMLYGTNAPGVGGLLGGAATGGLSADAIQELANLQAEAEAQQEYQEATEEAEEAAKTPEEKYNEAENSYVSDAISSLFDQEVKSEIETVFGKCKIVASTFGYTGTEGFAVQVMVPQKVTAENFNALVEAFTDQGYVTAYGEMEVETGAIMMQKDESTMLTLTFDTTSDEQGITVMYSVNE